MRYVLIRLERNWIFWSLILCLFLSVLICSVIYFKNSRETATEWGHAVEEYSSMTELEEQIESLHLQTKQIEEERNSCSSDEEVKNLDEIYVWCEESIEILSFLKDNQIKYADVVEGEVLTEDARDRRSYTSMMMEMMYIIQMVVAVLLACILVNHCKSNGTILTSIMLKGKTRCFLREMTSFYILMLLSFLIQTGMLALFRQKFPQTGTKVLYYTNNEIILFSAREEIWYRIGSLFLVLVPLLTVLLCISEIVTGILANIFISTVFIVTDLFLYANLNDNKWVSACHGLFPDISENGITGREYLLVQGIRWLLAGILLFFVFWFGKREKRAKQ